MSGTESEPAGTEPSGTGSARHVPVLMERVLELLAPALSTPAAVVVDATIGLGGHSEALLDAHPSIRLIGLDRDRSALAISAARLARYGDRVQLVHAVYDELPAVLADLDRPGVDAVLFDLGVSSMQLDEDARGFAYSRDAPLDMRMDASTGLTAADVVNDYAIEDLIRILREYGEERFAPRVARAIVRERDRSRLESTERLAQLVRAAIPAATRTGTGHPAKRTFQALRIEVNDELGSVRRAIPAALEALVVGGRIVVLAYHSLEDRIVKQDFAALAVDRTPLDLPVALAAAGPQLRVLTRGAERATEEEVAANPRAKPARLRAAERIRRDERLREHVSGIAPTAPRETGGGRAKRGLRRETGS